MTCFGFLKDEPTYDHFLLYWKSQKSDDTGFSNRSNIAGVFLIFGSEKLEICEKNPRRLQQPSRAGLGILQLVSILLISFSALFFGAFVNSAQAHGMHPNSASQPTVLTSFIEASDNVESIDNVQDAVKECGINCCSMTGCGYVPQWLEEVFLPQISTSLRQLFHSLPWVKNPLDSLQRPPRAFA